MLFFIGALTCTSMWSHSVRGHNSTPWKILWSGRPRNGKEIAHTCSPLNPPPLACTPGAKHSSEPMPHFLVHCGQPSTTMRRLGGRQRPRKSHLRFVKQVFVLSGVVLTHTYIWKGAAIRPLGSCSYALFKRPPATMTVLQKQGYDCSLWLLFTQGLGCLLCFMYTILHYSKKSWLWANYFDSPWAYRGYQRGQLPRISE